MLAAPCRARQTAAAAAYAARAVEEGSRSRSGDHLHHTLLGAAPIMNPDPSTADIRMPISSITRAARISPLSPRPLHLRGFILVAAAS